MFKSIAQGSKQVFRKASQQKQSKRFAASINARSEETPTGGTQTRMEFNKGNENNSNMMTYAIVGGAAAMAGYWWWSRTKSEKREIKERARETTHDAAKKVEQATKK